MRSEDLRLAGEFARRLRVRCDRASFSVTMFGSRARGDADDESDLDLFVEVRGGDAAAIKEAAGQSAGDLTLEHGLLVSGFVVIVLSWTRGAGTPFSRQWPQRPYRLSCE